MSVDVVKFAFIAGEISPTLYGRSDLTKYDLGMALTQNFFVDYRGGLSTRPGFEFCDFVKEDTQATRFVDFHFAPDLSNTYALLFGHHYVRFVQDGGYVLESSKAITAISSNGTITSAAHGLTNGRWVKLSGLTGANAVYNGRSLEVRSVTTNTFQLLLLPARTSISSMTAATSGSFQAVYEIASPYPAEALADLNFYQYRDLIRLTHNQYPIYNLVRNDHTNWTLTQETMFVAGRGPTITSGTPSATGDAQVLFAVTAVFADGSESVSGPVYLISNSINYTVEEGSVRIAWLPVAGAVSYNVYRSIVSASSALNSGTQLGYAGKTTGTSFVDSNITLDYTKAPPVFNLPFTAGAISEITVTNGGSGYSDFGATVSVTDPNGTGFVGDVSVSDSGAIISVRVLNPGTGYTAPVVSFGGGGSGATATAEILTASDTYPALSCIFQQRQIYASTIEKPLTVWGSQPRRFKNFNMSDFTVASDSFEVDIDSPSIAPISHMLVTRGGLLLLTQESVWLLNGGTSGAPIDPANVLADSQTFSGASKLDPIGIGSDLLYTEGRGYAVRILSYNEISRVYSGEDRSILSNHLFGADKTITSWCYQESPYKVVWGVRSDGRLVSFTTVREEDVFAWTWGDTKGYFRDIVNIREGTADTVYTVTERLVQGRWTKMLERMAPRQFVNVEDAWCVDSGLTNTLPRPNASLLIEFDGDEFVLLDSSAISDTNLTWVVRAAGGIFKIVERVGTFYRARIVSPPTDIIPQDLLQRIPEQSSGSWSLAQARTTFGGLWHLEGETVSILGDGNVFPQQTVVGGSITLPSAVTKIIVGLPFRAVARTLPLIVPDAGIEAKRKRIVGVAVRLDRSRGLKLGYDLDNLYEIRERTTEPYGFPIKLINEVKYQLVSSHWDPNGQTYFVQDNPLPVTLLGLVSDIEVGDDSD